MLMYHEEINAINRYNHEVEREGGITRYLDTVYLNTIWSPPSATKAVFINIGRESLSAIKTFLEILGTVFGTVLAGMLLMFLFGLLIGGDEVFKSGPFEVIGDALKKVGMTILMIGAGYATYKVTKKAIKALPPSTKKVLAAGITTAIAAPTITKAIREIKKE
jgi:hypothetical protein